MPLKSIGRRGEEGDAEQEASEGDLTIIGKELSMVAPECTKAK